MPVSVIIPALNEEQRIAETIDAAFAAGAAEVIVADGGSSDRTAAIAQEHGARLLAGERVRARQLNRGAEAAASEVLMFVHADTLLPPGACAAAEGAIEEGAIFGGFRISFIEPSRRLRVAAALINARTRLTREPWGDQAQFLRRETFVAHGGYPAMPLMEDYAFARRMCRIGRVALLPLAVRTSGRRFLQKGVVRTAATNWAIVAAWHLGVSPERLAGWYRARHHG